MTGRLQRMRSAITGRFIGSFDGIDHPDTTVMETTGDPSELRVAAEAVLLGAGFQQEAGRTEVNQRDLERLKAALGFEPGQP